MKLTHKLALLTTLSAICFSCGSKSEKDLSDAQIIERINQFRPSAGAIIPTDIKHRIGATHVAGKYHFTTEPYIIEGCRMMDSMGYGVIKLWFNDSPAGGYSYNSEWGETKGSSPKMMAQHPYYKACFDMPFSTIALSLPGAGVNTTDSSAMVEQQQVYELTKYLIETYKDRDVKFIIHNWEGDWIMRGGTGDDARWSRKAGDLIRAVDGDRYTVLVPNDSTERCQAMIKWFTARQNGVEQARAEMPESKCKVYHAIECNKVMDSMDDIPGVANSVVPFVAVDMVSWSCYDALSTEGPDNGLLLYKGIEYIRSKMQPSAYMNGEKVVFLGEIGVPEQRYPALLTQESVLHNWDSYLAVCAALDVPYIIQWELFCNEPKDESLRQLPITCTTDQMRGFYLIRPDGTPSFAGEYFSKILASAGKSI